MSVDIPSAKWKLDFVCIGPQRTSSSWLDQRLRQHPKVRLPEHVKETFFFDEHYERGEAWYRSLFGKRGAASCHGEVAPTYFDVPDAIARLVDHNPALKLICCLRDPVERAYSLYCLHYSKGRTRLPFGEACREMPRILDSGRYCYHLVRWARAFGHCNILLVSQREVARTPNLVLDAVAEYLGLPAIEWREADERYGQTIAPRSLWAATWAARCARLLRGAGAHRIVEFGKRMGLKSAVYEGGTHRYPPMTDNDRRMLETFYKDELEWFSSLTLTKGVVRLNDVTMPVRKIA